MSFRLTYATMFDPPEALHERFETALAAVRARLGARHAFYIDGADITGAVEPGVSPIDTGLVLGEFSRAGTAEIDAALRAAHAAWPAWRALPGAERVRALRRVADVMERRVYEIAAALVLEVGKNRMEALGEAQETVDFFRHYADDFEAHSGFERELPDDPLPGVVACCVPTAPGA
jgi:1-pyrroline-5-carboxylate dehydrogenase